MKAFEKKLRDSIEGEVHFDAVHKRVYSIDASIYEVEPVGIVLPKHKHDLINAVKIAHQFNVPVIARGAATGITGGCLGKALIIDISKYLNHILKIDYASEFAICEPGVVQDRLNDALYEHGYRLGPDTSTGNRATISGMVANNAAGSRSLRYGVMADHVEEVELILATGEVLQFGSVDERTMHEKTLQNNSEGRIYREILRIRKQYEHDIKHHFPKIPRRVSGYNLDALLGPFPLNISKIISGSEGTLGIFSEIKVRICKRPGLLGLCVVHFEDMFEGMKAIEMMLAFHPLALEMIDDKIIQMGKASPSMHNKLEWLVGNPKTVFVTEFEGRNHDELNQKLSAFTAVLKSKNIGYAHVNILDSEEMKHVWEVRKAGLGLLLSKRTYSRAIAFLEDITVSPKNLAAFMKSFCSYLKSKGKEAGIYGHVGSGCMHIRPYIDLRQPSELRLMEEMMNDIADMLLAHGGALSGEHGDGLIRSWLNKKMFGDRLFRAFKELKTAFDPNNLMNPGKIVDGPLLLNHLRMDPTVKIAKVPTFLDFTPEGGFELAVDMCNGNGLCRKKENIMCPSFQATEDEFHSTRARAQALRGIVNGKLPLKNLSSPEIYKVMDLCLECKGCKTECPSQVDMAKMKAEFLHHYHKRYGISMRARLFAYIGLVNQLNAPIAVFFNWMNKTFLAKKFLSFLGIATERPLPQLTSERFSKWFAKHQKPVGDRKRVVLMNDTFMEFNHPELGRSAVAVLEALGYHVIVPPWQCCGRPAFSKGLLDHAKKQAEKLVKVLLPFAEENIPIIGMEPSCLLTVKDEFSALLGHQNINCQTIASMCLTFDEFLSTHLKEGSLPLPLKALNQEILLHGHCHQKAIVGMRYTLDVLKALPGCSVKEIPSGCCGLAGSFGYETEHYQLSMKIGDLKLFPAIQNAKNALIVADGFSCRSQITHGTQRHALHLAEVIERALL
jgi:FAD/FMN-containing dehydrogenase/Fe-S oxidoreductase